MAAQGTRNCNVVCPEVSLPRWMAPFSDYRYLNVSQLICTMLAPDMLEVQGLLAIKQPASRIRGSRMTLLDSSLTETDLEKYFFAVLKRKILRSWDIGSKARVLLKHTGRVSERNTKRV